MVNVEPSPGALFTVMVPSCCSMRDFAIANPNPEPPPEARFLELSAR